MPATRQLAVLALVTLPLLAVPAAGARTWLVPQDAPTIQAAIDSAGTGDVIEIACGTYAEHDLVLSGTDLTLRGAAPSADCVTIDAGGAGRPLLVADATDVLLEGLTLTGADAGNYAGGGLAILRSAATVRDCAVVGNTSDAPGGGVWIKDSAPVTLQRCQVSENAGARGGGLEINASVVEVAESTVAANAATEGGGVTILAGADATFDDVVIVGNSAATASQGLVDASSQVLLHCCETDTLQWESLGTLIWDEEGCDVGGEPLSWGAIKSRYR